jgi:hypothetical protein
MRVTNEDIVWAKKHGWTWNGSAFMPEPVIQVIPNPMGHERPGWTPWLAPCGAIQTDAPFDSVRAAIRVAEQIRQGRCFELEEMSCADNF